MFTVGVTAAALADRCERTAAKADPHHELIQRYMSSRFRRRRRANSLTLARRVLEALALADRQSVQYLRKKGEVSGTDCVRLRGHIARMRLAADAVLRERRLELHLELHEARSELQHQRDLELARTHDPVIYLSYKGNEPEVRVIERHELPLQRAEGEPR